MSGHSHWATIKHKKGAVDAKRGKLWSKLSRAIIIAAKNGGGDPNMNLKLRYAIDKAREVSMPRDNIDRAIKRGTGDTEGAVFEEITYEGIGPGGAFILVDVLTDNRNRTSNEVRKIFDRAGGKMGSAGSVGYLFERKGIFGVEASASDEDTLMSIVLDAGADDLKRNGHMFEITCNPSHFSAIKQALEKANIALAHSDITQMPKVPRDVDTDIGQKVMRLMESLDDHDDVQNVYSDINVSEAMLAE
jgi:YebC/PmpR family DNA-binding regulatory protein